MTALIWAGALLAATAMLCAASLRAWRLWIDLRRYELAARSHGEGGTGSGTRIELSDIKERLRKLETIARGVDP
ncbi:MAG: hypothetical protein ACM3YM_10345 [Sphingomonadales bacterium]